MKARDRAIFGDFQTPRDLAARVIQRALGMMDEAPKAVVEPTCGEGAFLVEALRAIPGAAVTGYEINPAYAATAARVSGARVERADFFGVDWDRVVAEAPLPLLVIGNPPWITSAGLGALGADNAPPRQNLKGLSGLDARTGKGNFDVSEWMILRLLFALTARKRGATLAMVCKAAVARKVIAFAAQKGWPVSPGGLFGVDATRSFGAAVEAVALVAHVFEGRKGEGAWPVYASLEAREPERWLGVSEGAVVADVEAYERTRHLKGACEPVWRSGIKHDCAGVMELVRRGEGWVNGLGDAVEIEEAYRYPLLKSADVAHGRSALERAVIVPQRALGEDTRALSARAPKLWSYLMRHKERFDRRKSVIYKGQPPFAVFGVGAYSFAPWKVVVSGLYKQVRFRVVGPLAGQPVMVDDTCYCLPFASEGEARAASRALGSGAAREFFKGRVFWDDKRPINKAVLQALDWRRLSADGEREIGTWRHDDMKGADSA